MSVPRQSHGTKFNPLIVEGKSFLNYWQAVLYKFVLMLPPGRKGFIGGYACAEQKP